ncbi:MAG: 16S rRNA (uracil(1498)-N(3))-methyltransferase [Microbacterium sp.]
MALHFLIDAAPSGDVVELVGAEAHHAAVVRRVRVGERVSATDGAGLWLEGVCEHVDPKRVTVRIDERRAVPASSPRITLVQALAKGDRDERAIQAATELGVDEIVPWQASRSVSRWEGMKAEKGRTRWETIVREAAKQAHRAWLPPVTPVISTNELTARGGLIVLEPGAEGAFTSVPIDRDTTLVVGPEGGIAPEELRLLEQAGATLARLGDTVLRTSTAGPAALAVLNARLARW